MCRIMRRPEAVLTKECAAATIEFQLLPVTMPSPLEARIASLPLCPLAKRIAQPKRTGTLREQTEQSLSYQAFVYIVHLLHNFPEERMSAEKFIISSLLEKERAKKVAEGEFQNLSTVAALDDTWVAFWVAPKTLLRNEVLQRALMYDKKALNHFFSYMIGVHPSAKLPASCARKQYMSIWRDFLWEAKGKPLAPSDKKQPVSLISEVNWGLLAYSLVFDAEKGCVTKIVHRRTKVEVELDEVCRITDKFVLKDGWSDSGALATNGKASHYILKELFPAGVGPHASGELRGKGRDFDPPCRHADAKLAEIEESLAVVRADEGKAIVEKTMEEAKKARTDAARIALTARRQEMGKLQRQSVATLAKRVRAT